MIRKKRARRHKDQPVKILGRKMNLKRAAASIARCDDPDQLVEVITLARRRLNKVTKAVTKADEDKVHKRLRTWERLDRLVLTGICHSYHQMGETLRFYHYQPIKRRLWAWWTNDGVPGDDVKSGGTKIDDKLSYFSLKQIIEMGIIRDKPEALLGSDVTGRREQLQTMKRMQEVGLLPPPEEPTFKERLQADRRPVRRKPEDAI